MTEPVTGLTDTSGLAGLVLFGGQLLLQGRNGVELPWAESGDRKVRDVLSRLVRAACQAPPTQAWLVAGMHRSTFGGPEPDWAVELLKV